jgi:hypothetical protein
MSDQTKMNDPEANVVTLKIDDVPPFLRNSEFFNSLLVDSGEEFTVPKECFKATPSINNAAELDLMLSAVRFWGVSGVPNQITEFFVSAKSSEEIDLVVSKYAPELKFLQHLRELQEDGVCRCCTAVRSGEVDILRHICESDKVICSSCNSLACEIGSLSCLKYLHEHHECPLHEGCAQNAVKYGNLDCLQYIHAKLQWRRFPDLLQSSALYGQLECMRYIYEHDLDSWCGWEPFDAAERDHVECLQYALEHGCLWSTGVTASAASNGSARCLAYLLAHWKADLAPDSCTGPARKGHLECL